MAETPVTVDPTRLAAVAGRVEHCADALARVRVPDLDPAALRGAAVSRTGRGTQTAAQVDGLAADLRAWAGITRSSAAALEGADRDSASRM